MRKEWQIYRNGHVWTDRLNSEEEATEHMEECMGEETEGATFEIEEMSYEDLLLYKGAEYDE